MRGGFGEGNDGPNGCAIEKWELFGTKISGKVIAC